MRTIVLLAVLCWLTLPVKAEILWSVENNFRFLKPTQANAEVRNWLDRVVPASLDPYDSKITIDEMRTGGFSSVPETFYDKSTRLYSKDYVHSRLRLVNLALAGATAEQSCTWKAIGKEFSGACLRFTFPEPFKLGSTELTVVRDDGYEEFATIKIVDKLIYIVGDSYASGEGVPDVMCRRESGQRCPDSKGKSGFIGWFIAFGKWLTSNAKSKAQWLEPDCDRSIYAWPMLAAYHYARKHPQQSVTVLSRACSGAEGPELLYKPFVGKNNDGKNEPPQLDQMMADLCPVEVAAGSKCENPKSPDVVVLSIGGNDAGFATRILRLAASPLRDLDRARRKNGVLDLTKKLEREVVTELKKLTNQKNGILEQAAERVLGRYENTSVVHALYPDPLHATRKRFCGDYRVGGRRMLNIFGKKTWPLYNSQTHQERVIALYEGFISRLVGVKAPPFKDYRGLRHAGDLLSKKHGGRWKYVETRRHDDTNGNGYHQSVGYQPNGYCVPGNDVNGRWFLNVLDAYRDTGKVDGTMHPNIFGQLYMLQKVYPEIEKVLAD